MDRPDIDLPRLSKDDLITEVMRLRRLCKELTDEWYKAALEATPAMPTPDWSQAPEWAQWWAMEGTGWAYWYSHQPRISERYSTWESSGDNTEADYIEHSNWRTTLQQRPTDTPRTGKE